MKNKSLWAATIFGLLFLAIQSHKYLYEKSDKSNEKSFPLVNLNAEFWMFNDYNELLKFCEKKFPEIDFESILKPQASNIVFEKGLCLYRIRIPENVILYMMDPVFAEPNQKLKINEELVFDFFYKRTPIPRLWALFSLEDSSLYAIGSNNDIEHYRDLAYTIYSSSERLRKGL